MKLSLLIVPVIIFSQLLSYSELCFAEEDLLNILESSAGQTMPNLQKKSKVSKVRDLIKASEGQVTAEQNIFVSFFESGDFQKALFQWTPAFQKSAFARTVNGQAMHAWLLFKNGLELAAIENLLSIKTPSQMTPFLQEEWRKEVPSNHAIWGFVSAKYWNADWEKVFDLDTTIRIMGREVYRDKNAELLKSMMSESQPGTSEFAWLLWQDILMGINKDTSGSAQKLAQLMKVNNNTISLDLMNITAARLLYQNGYLDAAVKYYEKVSKKSDYWFEAQEEMAWSYLRKGEPQNSIAIVKSISKPEFVKWAGPEALYLRTIAELKVCDYPAVLRSLAQYRESFKTRATKMSVLAKGEDMSVSEPLAQALKTAKVVSVEKLGATAESTPRFALRDHQLRQIINRELKMAAEAKRAGELYAGSLSEGSGQVGFQGALEELRLNLQQRQQAEVATRNLRIKKLAENELKEISDILQKMHVVEAEVISQTTLATRVAEAKVGEKKVQDGSTGSKDPYALIFAGNQETWFDEIGNYRVQVKGACGSVTK